MAASTKRFAAAPIWATLLVLSQLPGCSPPQPATGNPSSPVTLTIGVPNVAGQDPLRGIQQAARLISFEGLVNVGRDGRAVPRLAESWSRTDDGLTWTFKLRSSALFHDGTPVTAVAVKTSLERSIASADRDLTPGLADILSIEAPNDGEVSIRLRSQSTFLLDDLGISVSKIGDAGVQIGTGSHIMAPPVDGQIALTAFRKYYRGSPTIERVLIRPYPTVRTAWAAMMRGEIDFLYEVGQDAREFIEGEDSTTVFPFFRNYIYGVIFNSRLSQFRDPRVRRALNLAVDREAIVSQAFGGRAKPASGAAWPEHWAYNSSASTIVHDPARASALLDAAGFRNLTQVPSRPPARLHFVCLFPENLPLWERMALLVQRDLAQIGVDMALEAVPINVFGERLASGKFDVVLLEHIVGNGASRPVIFWYSRSRQNVWGFHSPEIDLAMDDLRRASSDAQYREAFRRFQEQTLEHPPEIALAIAETARAVSKRFEVVAPMGSDILPTIADWRLADGARQGAN